jgi:hypothetical protein
VDQVMAARLQIDAFARRVGADQDAQRITGGVGESSTEVRTPRQNRRGVGG